MAFNYNPAINSTGEVRADVLRSGHSLVDTGGSGGSGERVEVYPARGGIVGYTSPQTKQLNSSGHAIQSGPSDT